jgi:hypothetical protein
VFERFTEPARQVQVDQNAPVNPLRFSDAADLEASDTFFDFSVSDLLVGGAAVDCGIGLGEVASSVANSKSYGDIGKAALGALPGCSIVAVELAG